MESIWQKPKLAQRESSDIIIFLGREVEGLSTDLTIGIWMDSDIEFVTDLQSLIAPTLLSESILIIS